VIEVEVHQQLRAFLREQGEPYWPHHLTMARLVARALRLGRSALIQAGAPSGFHGRYRLSYLMPALLWPGATVLVVPDELRQRLLMVEVPRLRQWLPPSKSIAADDRFQNADFQGLLITSPAAWLGDRLHHRGQFPVGIPTIIDGVDDLEFWARQQLTCHLDASDWESLMLAFPDQAEAIRDLRIQLIHIIFQHPANPFGRHLLDVLEQEILQQLWDALGQSTDPDRWQTYLPNPWQRFWTATRQENALMWVDVLRHQGQFRLHCGPMEVQSALAPVWPQQPVVLVGGALDLDADAPIYRQRIGLADATCVKFTPDRQNEVIQLYLSDRIPLPNTPQFQPALMAELRRLLMVSTPAQGLTVILVGDTPLKAQVGSVLAAEFGSRVQVEKTCLDDQGILVSGWEFWRQHQGVLPAPQLLVIATLPIPSLEDPLVAGRVTSYKNQRQDWFRLYLLPEAISELQRAIAPVRESQGVVALLDNRVNYRSYGQQILNALSPLARVNYIDASLFKQFDYSVLD
jgi:ATP-dependent DNA helicase DinG